MVSRSRIAAFLVFVSSWQLAAFAEVHKQGMIEVDDHCSVNLAQGEVSCFVTLDGDGTELPVHPRGKRFDFWYKSGGKAQFLNPENGTVFSVGELSASGLSGCTTATFSKRRIRADQLPTGTYICVRNGQGRIGEIQLEGIDRKRHRLSIAFVSWTK